GSTGPGLRPGQIGRDGSGSARLLAVGIRAEPLRVVRRTGRGRGDPRADGRWLRVGRRTGAWVGFAGGRPGRPDRARRVVDAIRQYAFNDTRHYTLRGNRAWPRPR